jgi:hypothetical protein
MLLIDLAGLYLFILNENYGGAIWMCWEGLGF